MGIYFWERNTYKAETIREYITYGNDYVMMFRKLRYVKGEAVIKIVW